MDVSPAQPASSSFTRFRSSVHSTISLPSLLLAGRNAIRSLILVRIVASSATTSTIPLSSDWNTALEESHFATEFPSSALGALTKSFPFFSSMKVKSVSVGNRASPPPQLPSTAVIWGITPEASVCFM